MVWCDIEENGNVCMKIIHVVQLEAAQLYNIMIEGAPFGNLQGKRTADIACQTYVVVGILQNVIYETCCGSLAIASGYANHFCIGVATGKFYFVDYVNAKLDGLGHNGCIVGDARTFDYFRGIQYFFRRMLSFFPIDAILV